MAPQPDLMAGELTSFVGRRQELADVRRLLSTGRLVTLTGMGGVGKTRLALRLATEARRAFPDGIGVVELALLKDPELLPHYVMETLDIRDQSSRPAVDVLCDHLHAQRLLLVMDNCEHVVAAAAHLVDTLLRAAPGLRVLATSTQPLRLSAEHVFVVPPLRVPGAEDHVEPGTATQYPAVSLFADRSSAVVPDFTLVPGNEAAVVRLCQRLEGIPLAIELAAVNLKVLSIDGIIERLDDRFALLREGSRDLPERHRTLQAVIDWSHDLCTAQEQALWARAAVFTGGFTVEALETVCADDVVPAATILGTVSGLVDKSIFVREQVGSGVRFEMLETIRAYGLTQLQHSGAEHATRRRHRDWCLNLLLSAGDAWTGERQEDWATRLMVERPNLRGALEWSLAEPGEARMGQHMAAAPWFWLALGHFAEGRLWLHRALALDDTPGLERSWALVTMAYLAVCQGDTGEVPELIRQALEATPDDASVGAFAQLVLGTERNIDGELSDAVEFLTDALERFSTVDLPGQYADLARIELASAHILSGQLDAAGTLVDELFERCRVTGSRWQLSYALWGRGLIGLLRDQLDQAEADASEAIRIKRHFQDTLGLALTVELLAWITVQRGDARRGATLIGGANGIWQTVGSRLMGSSHLIEMGERFEASARSSLGEGDYQAARDLGTRLAVDEAVALALREHPAPSRTPPARASTVLTRREREVAALVGEGLSNKEIASKLVISVRTVEAHVEHILTKLDFTARTQVAHWVAQQQ
ncbi:ATP-binding protein [Nocardioides speluncae]|uniref:ATP-binding protein n=1 Tax=Nocardioides speluncae TaxID=2670337 RepID=UPI000D695E26|nr:LuxR C-terminal-related transcriptional regulator [Nocardioides speluncae]